MTQTTFKVDKRAAEKPKHLRQQGVIPGNIFGKAGSIAVQMPALAFRDLYQEVGETGLVYLEVAGSQKQHPVLVDEVQVDPVDSSVVHVAFKQVDLTDKIKAEVPVEVIGKFEVPEAVMVVVKDKIEVEALPTDLPEKFEIDVSTLTAVGQMIAYKDLHFDRSKVTLILGEEGEEEPVVLVQEQREEEPEEVPVVEAVEGEEGAVAAGEQPESEAGKPGEEVAVEGGAEQTGKKPAEKPTEKPDKK